MKVDFVLNLLARLTVYKLSYSNSKYTVYKVLKYLQCYLENGGKTATGMRPNGTKARAATDVADVAIGSPPPLGVPGGGLFGGTPWVVTSDGAIGTAAKAPTARIPTTATGAAMAGGISLIHGDGVVVVVVVVVVVCGQKIGMTVVMKDCKYDMHDEVPVEV